MIQNIEHVVLYKMTIKTEHQRQETQGLSKGD